jgi:pimeloyl-ACP methyl ester carboxylesterase
MMRLLLLLLGLLIASLPAIAQPSAAFSVTVTGEGPDLFFIPGATCSGDVWDETVAQWQAHYTCHVFTLAGYAGQPALAETPVLPQWRAALKDYIVATGPGRKTLIGHSIGGFIGLQLAIDHPELLDRLVVVDALPFLAAVGNPSATEETASPYTLEATVQFYANMDEAAFNRMQRQVVSSMLRDTSYHERVLAWSLASDRGTMAHSMYEMLTTDLRQEIAQITTPTLVLGAWDASYPYDRDRQQRLYAEQYAQLPKLDLRMTPSAKHFIMYDAPAWMHEQLRTFLLPQTEK